MKKSILFFIIFCFCVPVYAKTTTLYLRSDSHIINTVNAEKLLESNSSSDGQFGGTDTESNIYWTTNISIVHEDGSSTALATSVASINRSTATDGSYTATWSCPATALNPTDAIYIYEKIGTTDGGDSVNNAWISEQLGWAKLNAATWTFTKYLYLQLVDIGPPQLFSKFEKFGSSSLVNKIEGVSFQTPSLNYSVII